MEILEKSIAQLIELAQTLDKAKEDLRIQMNELKAENEELKAMLNDGWRDRVTYDNVVEQIASNEDAAHRDIASKTFEPLLKKETARKFRRDIKRKVKEMNDGEGGRTFNNYGTYNEVQAGGTNITNNQKDGGN